MSEHTFYFFFSENVLITKGVIPPQTIYDDDTSVVCNPSHKIDALKNQFHSRTDFSQRIDSVMSMPGALKV